MLRRYSTDENNRLVITQGKNRLMPDGRFVLDTGNRLTYYVDESPAWRKLHAVPAKFDFEGEWKLDLNHDFVLKLHKKGDYANNSTLVLQGAILAFEGNRIALEVKSSDKDGKTHFQILQFSGVWQADRSNRLSFVLQKKKEPDIIFFEGAWEINRNQLITYSYQRKDLKTGNKNSHTLVFQGFWQISDENRIRYIMRGALNSFFDFRVQAESPTLYPHQNKIRYRIGVGIKGRKPSSEKIVILYGEWKFSRQAGISFEMDYGDGKVERLEFGAEVYTGKNNEITLSLVNRRKEPVGISITITHKFLKDNDGEAFVRLRQLCSSPAVEAGVRIPF